MISRYKLVILVVNCSQGNIIDDIDDTDLKNSVYGGACSGVEEWTKQKELSNQNNVTH